MHKNQAKLFILLSICLSILLSAFIFIPSKPIDRQPKPAASEGILDLTGWNWQRDGIVALNGQWEFYWHELLTPENFKEIDTLQKKDHITLPRAWNKYIFKDKPLSGFGYATYRLLVHHASHKILGIKIPRIFTSYNLWVDGELLASAGKVSTESKQMIPQYLPQVKYFMPKTSTIEIVIQVANFRHRSGGILESIQMGSASQISNLRTRNLALDLFLFGSLFIIGFYHIALYLFRTKDRSALYLGIYTVLISARTILVGEIFLIHMLPHFNWEAAHKIQTLAYYVSVPLFVLFLKEVFPGDTSKKMNAFTGAFASGFALLVLLTPARIFTKYNPIYQVFSFAVFIYIFLIIIRSCLKKKEGSILIGIGLSILILTAVNDIIFLSIVIADSDNHFLRDFVSRGNLSSLGLLIFIFMQSLVLAKKFTKSFFRVELLTKQLQQLNAGLEEKVRERTLALESSKNELNKAYLAVSRSEKSLKTLTQNISHDLRTPLSAIKGYVNTILDEIVKDPEHQKKYLRRVIGKVDYLNHMVQELLDLSQLQSRQLMLNLSRVPVNSLIQNISEKFSFDMKNVNVTFNIHHPPEWQNDDFKRDLLFVEVDLRKLERVFSNLLNNASKFTSEGGNIDLYFNFAADNKKLIIEVSDTGIGILKEELPHIFERFYMVSKARQVNNSSGLGLAIAKEIVEYHGGEIWAESDIGQGNHFFFTLPLHSASETT
jgi:signal transduction histidine kinase